MREVLVNTEVRPLGPVMGAEVAGVDLSRPLEQEIFRRIKEAFHRYLLLVFPDQHIDEAQQIAFSRRFRALERGQDR